MTYVSINCGISYPAFQCSFRKTFSQIKHSFAEEFFTRKLPLKCLQKWLLIEFTKDVELERNSDSSQLCYCKLASQWCFSRENFFRQLGFWNIFLQFPVHCMNTVINISWKRMKMHKNKNKTQQGMDKKMMNSHNIHPFCLSSIKMLTINKV